MWTRWMTAGAVLVACLTGCSQQVDSQPSEPSSVPKQASENAETPKSPFKQVEARPIDDMQRPVVVDQAPRRLDTVPVTSPVAEVTTPMPQPVTPMTTVEPDETPKADDKDEDEDEPAVAEDERRRRRTPRRGGGAMVSPPIAGGFPTRGGFGAGFGMGAGGFSAGFGEDTVPMTGFDSDDFSGTDEYAAGYTGGGPITGFTSGMDGVPDSVFDFAYDFDLIGDELAGTTDSLTPPIPPRTDIFDQPGIPTGPTDGGLAPAPPVPPPDF